MPPPRPHADRTSLAQPPRHPDLAVARKPGEHPTAHERRRLRDLERPELATRPPEQLGGDGRPRRIFVDSSQLHAVEARPDARLDERPDRDGSFGRHNRQMRHVAIEPMQMIGRRHDPVRDQHDQIGIVC
jgi:hypothetical protein